VAAPAWAQEGPEGNFNAVWNNTSPSALARRSPGNLVTDGIVRHQENFNRAFSRPEITETERPTKIIHQLKADAIEIIFDNLNAILLAFNAAIRAQGGLDPFIPGQIGGIDTGGLPGLGGLDVGSLLNSGR
jgi:hypothetical protein